MSGSAPALRASWKETLEEGRCSFYHLLDDTDPNWTLFQSSATADSPCSSCSRIPLENVFISIFEDLFARSESETVTQNLRLALSRTTNYDEIVPFLPL
jgi:hypothetical protein